MWVQEKQTHYNIYLTETTKITNYTHIHTVIKYFPKLRLFMCFKKVNFPHLSFSPLTPKQSELTKHSKSTYSLLVFVWKIFGYVQFENIHYDNSLCHICYTSIKIFLKNPLTFWGWEWEYQVRKHKMVFISFWKCTNRNILSTQNDSRKEVSYPWDMESKHLFPLMGREPNSCALIPRGLCQIGRVLNEEELPLSLPKQILPGSIEWAGQTWSLLFPSLWSSSRLSFPRHLLPQVPAAMFVSLKSHYWLLEGRGLVFSCICTPYLKPTEQRTPNRQTINVS